MSLFVIGETALSEFSFVAENGALTAIISSLTCEGQEGQDEYSYSVIVKDEQDNVVMKEIHDDFQMACDIYDRLSILVGRAIIN